MSFARPVTDPWICGTVRCLWWEGGRAEARYRSDVAMMCLIVSESQTWEMQR